MRYLVHHRICLVAVLLAIGVANARRSTVASEPAAQQAILRKAGLREHQRRWICREESRLLRQLERVDKWIDEVRRLRRGWEALGDEQNKIRERIKRNNAAIEQLDREIESVGADALRRLRLERRQQVLRTAMARDKQELHLNLDGLNEQSKLSIESRKLANLLAEGESLRMALQAADRSSRHWYDGIDATTRGAIAALRDASGARAELGPIRDYSTEITAQLQKLSAALDVDASPIYRENSRPRVPVLLNGGIRATFGVEDEISISIAPSAMLLAANVKIPIDAERKTITLGDYRVSGRVVRVDQLRVGGLVLRDLEMIAAEPGADTAEPLLAAAVFDDKPIAWDFERLLIRTARPQ